MLKSGEIFYGCHWTIASDEARDAAVPVLREAVGDDNADLYDALDALESKHDAHISFNGEDVTLYFGVPVTNVTEGDNEFDEMSILRVMDLEHGSLRKDVREKMTKIMDSVPFVLRDHVSAPKFRIAWSAH